MQDNSQGNPFSGFREIVTRQRIDFGNFKYPKHSVFLISSVTLHHGRVSDVNKLSKRGCQYILQMRYFLDATLKNY